MAQVNVLEYVYKAAYEHLNEVTVSSQADIPHVDTSIIPLSFSHHHEVPTQLWQLCKREEFRDRGAVAEHM